jgi:hypothetical protein
MRQLDTVHELVNINGRNLEWLNQTTVTKIFFLIKAEGRREIGKMAGKCKE